MTGRTMKPISPDAHMVTASNDVTCCTPHTAVATDGERLSLTPTTKKNAIWKVKKLNPINIYVYADHQSG